jgi:uncharacterized surface protein with fasciclin (FAS1) repeats
VALKKQTNKKQMKSKTLQKTNRVSLALTAMLAITGFSGMTYAEEVAKTNGSYESGRNETNAKTGDIVSVAVASGKFKTLAAALKAAGLVETLQGTGPFTVFAPTDEAFAKLPKGTLDELLMPENKKKLAGILTYHVLAGKVMAADVKTTEAKTVNGQKLKLVVMDGKVTVNKAKVIIADVAASNGVIHAIDTVLMPE